MGEKMNAYGMWVGKPEGKRPLGRPRWWVDDSKIDLREVGWGGMEWIQLAQDRSVDGSCEYGNEHLGSINVGKFLSSCITGGFSRRAQLHEVGYLCTMASKN
jgi:hypothetical protein